MSPARLGTLLLMLALVIVPTVMRSRQHVELRESTRLSIRLNWQSDAPPQKDLFAPDAATVTVAPIALVPPPHEAHVAKRMHAFEEPVLQPPFDNAPDLVRGPPSVLG